jgi:hypothetical protein
MTDRKFNEDEVAAIFERASVAQPADSRSASASNGMTLAQLQEIGREVGIAPDAIANAALSIDRHGTATTRRLFGLPIGVARTVDLPRKLSDAEWERVVVDLRETFDARGVMRSEGSFRQWTNGNLQVLLEPSQTGQRLRFRTIKGDAGVTIGVGITLFGVAASSVLAMASRDGRVDAGAIVAMSVLASSALAMVVYGTMRVPHWAKTRARQMEEIASRVIQRLTADS